MISPSDFEISLGFENVAIKQKKNRCTSRLDVNTESEVIRGVKRGIPLIASNMSTVTNADFCIELYHLGALGVMHRACSDDEACDAAKRISSKCEWTCSSIGIGDSQFELARKLIKSGANVLFIDIAHGYCDSVIDLGRKIKHFSKETKVVVGNTTNPDMLEEVEDFASAVKTGLANGFACQTKDTAGCTAGQFSAVWDFRVAIEKTGIPIISDGGVRLPSDFVKSVGAGASGVMAGKIFASCPESAAELVTVDGKEKKLYAGMASRYVQNKWKGGVKNGTCTEGTIKYLEVGESAEKLVERYLGALRSGITYAGCTNIEEFKKCCEFIHLV